MSEEGGRNVAIACQGGGSHTAFTAGALSRLLPAIDRGDDRLVGISGTSGGAFAAAAAWYGHLADGAAVPDVLEHLWEALIADGPMDRTVNDALVWGTRLESMGVPTVELGPHAQPFSEWGQARLRRTLTDVVDVEAIPHLATAEAPELVVGTVDVEAGTFEAYTNADVTADVLLASAAVPSLYRAVEIDGDYHWDGLFSQNPPIRDLYHVPPDRKPDELWVLQINPQTREGEPTCLHEITDRRNELAGNISLNQELHGVEQINEFLAEGYLPDDEYRHTEIHRLALDDGLSYASKLDRSPEFVDDLRAAGRERADAFLAQRDE